jgi:uncharacterized protein YyaL (SSP411 family)
MNKATFQIGLLAIFLSVFSPLSNVVAMGPQENPAAKAEAAQVTEDQPKHKHTNKLVGESSPYLLQHAHNPVNWYPWGPEAFAKAVAENKPVFLSVGYSTCYWCHVMERESFEKEDVAEILNEHFVCIKVDREERPEVDQQYMLATQILSRRGGWPNSVWLTPEGKPWMAGTYFPKKQFKEALNRLAGFWQDRNKEVLKQADQLAEAVEQMGAPKLDQKPIAASLLTSSISASLQRFDKTNGGFGGKPKFPPHANLVFLIDRYQASETKDPKVLQAIETTLSKMSMGGVYDHVGGGFHRYSTDEKWLLPHFEKMLYDNAQLMKSYTDGYLLTNKPRHRETVEGIFQWLNREMTSSEGGFYSALDSESNAEEGQYYVWTYAEVLEVLGEDRGPYFATIYGVKEGGNFKEEATGHQSTSNVLHLQRPIADFAQQDLAGLEELLAGQRERLREARRDRDYPHLDDKVIAAWNGLMIEGLACAGRKLEEPKYVAAAKKAADFVLAKMMKDGKLQRTYRNGQAKLDGYLNDYAFVGSGMLELYHATEDEKYLNAAKQLADRAIADFQDEQFGGFFFTAKPSQENDGEFVIRSKNLGGGGNLPTGNGVMAQLLFQLADVTGDDKYEAVAKRTVEGLSGYLVELKGQADHLLIAAATMLESQSANPTNSVVKSEGAGGPNVADATFEATAVEGAVFLSSKKLAAGDQFRVSVRLTIAEGYHLYGPNPDVKVILPTSIVVDENKSVEVVKVTPPKGVAKMDPNLKQELETYEGEVTFQVDMKIADNTPPGGLSLGLQVKTQACDDRQCARPSNSSVKLPLEILPAAGK